MYHFMKRRNNFKKNNTKLKDLNDAIGMKMKKNICIIHYLNLYRLYL